MFKKLKESNKGFTIIEVMIVLAIAALILLIVLLAVPALQRNSRNTAIKNDASAVVGGVSEFESNNDGASPKSGAGNSSCSTGSVSLSAGATTAPSLPKVQGSTGVTCTQTGAVTVSSVNPGNLVIVFGAKCPDTVAGNATNVTTVVSARSTAVVYIIETNGANQYKCVDG
jgi:prepilin-type N-terminal cleavage/methylation domain-containing protein